MTRATAEERAGTTVAEDVPEGCLVRDDGDTVRREL